MKLIIPKYFDLLSFAKKFDVEVAFFGHLLLFQNFCIAYDIFTVPQECTPASISWDCEWKDYLDLEFTQKILNWYRDSEVVPFGLSIHKHPGDFGFSTTDLSQNGICNRFGDTQQPQVDLVMGKSFPVVDLHTKNISIETVYIEIYQDIYVKFKPETWSYCIFTEPPIFEPISRVRLDKNHIRRKVCLPQQILEPKTSPFFNNSEHDM